MVIVRRYSKLWRFFCSGKSGAARPMISTCVACSSTVCPFAGEATINLIESASVYVAVGAVALGALAYLIHRRSSDATELTPALIGPATQPCS